jgi:catechol 2,3-dioxygenase-like lactoylglutathione lyase family enzyme
MIDHIYLPVTDLKRSDAFYGCMLGPLGKRRNLIVVRYLVLSKLPS